MNEKKNNIADKIKDLNKIEKIRNDYDKTSNFYDKRYKNIQYLKYAFLLSKLFKISKKVSKKVSKKASKNILKNISETQNNLTISLSELILDYGGGTGLLFEFLRDLKKVLYDIQVGQVNLDEIEQDLLPFLLLSVYILLKGEIFDSKIELIMPNMLICDISYGMLENFYEKKKENMKNNDVKINTLFNNIGNISLIQCDGQNLPFRENSFNCVCAFTVIQNLPDRKKGYNEISRVSKNKSEFGISMLKKADNKLRIISELSESFSNFRSILSEDIMNNLNSILKMLEKRFDMYFEPNFLHNASNNIEDFFFYKIHS